MVEMGSGFFFFFFLYGENKSLYRKLSSYVHPGVLAFGYVNMTMPLLPADCSCSSFSVTDLPSSVVTSMLPMLVLRSMVSPTASSLAGAAAGTAGTAGEADDDSVPFLDFFMLEAEARLLVGGGAAAAADAADKVVAGLLRSSTIISDIYIPKKGIDSPCATNHSAISFELCTVSKIINVS